VSVHDRTWSEGPFMKKRVALLHSRLPVEKIENEDLKP
jgi:hypothetical protein